MKTETKVYEVSRTIIREETDKEKLIFQWNETINEWTFRAPNAQEHSEEQLKIALQILSELNQKQKVN